MLLVLVFPCWDLHSSKLIAHTQSCHAGPFTDRYSHSPPACIQVAEKYPRRGMLVWSLSFLQLLFSLEFFVNCFWLKFCIGAEGNIWVNARPLFHAAMKYHALFPCHPTPSQLKERERERLTKSSSTPLIPPQPKLFHHIQVSSMVPSFFLSHLLTSCTLY